MNERATETNPPRAVERGRGTLWLVWLIPLVAFMVTGWMIYKYYAERGVDIVVTFDSGNGVEIGKTPLLYKGIKIGTVSDVAIDPGDLSKVNVTITVDRRAIGGVARKGNTFVMVHPKVTLTEVTGLETILSGNYIEVVPAEIDTRKLHRLPEQYRFMGTDKLPTQYTGKGVYVSLRSKDGSLSTGTPVLYRKFVVGKVVKQELDEQGVRYIAHIDPDYSWLVKENSRFWQLSGMELKATLAGIKFSFDSLASMLVGGIAFDSPETGAVVREKTIERKLFSSEEAARFSEDAIVLDAREAYNLEPQLSSVYYNGIAVGKVENVLYLPKTDRTRITVRIDRRFRHLANADAHFWIVRPQLSLKGVEGLDAIARGAYIAFSSGSKDAEQRDEFVLESKARAPEGVRVKLRIDEAQGIRSGTPLFFKDIEVGTITEVGFSPASQRLEAEAVVRKRYARFLNDSSRFYVRSGLEAELSLAGAYVKSGSLEEIVSGGIAFVTSDPNGRLTHKEFRLFKSYKMMQDYRYVEGSGTTVRLRVPDMGSLSAGDPVLYKRNKAGEIVSIDYDAAADDFILKLFITHPFHKKINRSTRFSIASGIELKMALPTITVKTESLETILRGGLSFTTPDDTALKADDNWVFSLYDTAQEYHPFSLYSDTGHGLKPGSAITYKGVPVGKVETLRLEDDHVEITALIEKRYATLLDSATWFWTEAFEAGIDGVRNADAALTGPSIALLPGMSGTQADHFRLRDAAPPPTYGKAGMRFTLVGDRKSSLKAGSPLYYRQVQIGQVESCSLADDGTGVNIGVYVEPKYAHLVRENSRFYNATAFGMSVNLLGVKVSTETVETMLSGGIGMAVPDPAEAPAKAGTRFRLYNEPEEAWLEWKPRL
jgi:paraquat-inducible protein B